VVPRIFSTVRYLQGQSKSGVAGLEQATNRLPLIGFYVKESRAWSSTRRL
jgi:hypothetical protein